MTEEDLEVEAQNVLAFARRGFAPTSDDAARVLRKTRAALHAVPPAASVGLRQISTAALATAATVIALVSGSIGYVLGHEWPAQTPTVHALPALRVPVTAPLLMVAPTPSAPVIAAAAETVQAAPITPAAPQRVRPKLPAPEAPAAVSVTSKPQEAVAESLDAELKALRRIELALRDQDPRLALSLLDRLDRDIPNGKLSEERSAAFVVARCAIGLGSRAALLREFEAQHPDSVYLARVEQSCRTARQ